jgi:predicted transcriptional regulator
MRTTLTLDDDVAAALERLRRARDASLKDVVNDALRRGLNELTVKPRRRDTFRTKSVELGRLRIIGIDNVSESLAIAEDEAFN